MARPGARGVIPAADSLLPRPGRRHRRTAQAGGPVTVLLGHSMGGLVAARFVAEALQPQPARLEPAGRRAGAVVAGAGRRLSGRRSCCWPWGALRRTWRWATA
jgi:pimeloyl-ACP methyl ester carboxylesterase